MVRTPEPKLRWVRQPARRYNADGPEALGDRRPGNPGDGDRALLTAEQREELGEALRSLRPTGMWNSRRVGEWIEAKSTNKVVSKKQRC
jgi:hypothetical protein